MKTPIRGLGRASIRGFTLIEILIAVVILATGLLALTALQGRLAQTSAEAKTRSRVATMLSARMDELRVGQYGNPDLDVVTGTGSKVTNFTCASAAPDWLCTTQTESSVTGLGVRQQVDRYTSAVSAGSFSISGTPADSVSIPEFKRITLLATWTDATGGGRRLSVTSDVSPLSIGSDKFITEHDPGTGGGKAIVRQDSPETAGVIPIALGDGNSTAASNPKPELTGDGESITATSFNILTYVPGGTSAVIQKRFENEVIKCKCQYGAAGNSFSNLGAIYQKAEWPAVWTGSRYDVYVPSAATNAPGTTFISGQASGVTQSDLCTECCRDHHDTAATGVAKFDPERSVGVSKYDANLAEVTNVNSGSYVDACRVIRVDGFWRVASDMYARQMGLLETETVSSVQAKTGLPTTAATSAYETFVKDYLDAYTGGTGTAPSGAQAMFDATGLNAPATVTINTPSNTDYRYLHDRGLYVDYLEADARTVVADAITNCATGVAIADCVLPVLPFTTINLTEIAKWTASAPSILTINSGNLLATDPSQPSGSRTIGIANGPSDSTAEMRLSNSGVAVQSTFTFNGVDTADNTDVYTDSQAFQVGSGTGSGTGQSFTVRVSGGGPNPYVYYTVSADTGECFKPSGTDHSCATNSTLGVGGSVRVSNYNPETTTDVSMTTVLASVSNQCTYGGNPVTVEIPNGNGPNTKIATPILRNYSATSVAIAGVPALTIGYTNDLSNQANEYLTATFLAIPSGSRVDVTLAQESGSPIYATLLSCTAILDKGKYYYSAGTWSKPWVP